MYTAIVFLVLIGVVGYIVFTFIKSYMSQTTGSVWQKMLATARDSETILWAKFVALVSSGVGLITPIATYLGDPSLATAIQNALKPEYVAIFGVIVAVVTIVARKMRATDLK